MTVVCNGLLVESSEGVGECDQGEACQAHGLRGDYEAYRAADGRVIADEQAKNRDEYGRRGLTLAAPSRTVNGSAKLDPTGHPSPLRADRDRHRRRLRTRHQLRPDAQKRPHPRRVMRNSRFASV